MARPRLSIERMEFRDRSIIEVVAPAGFGKTTLLNQWRREVLNTGGLVAWLTLDGEDSGPRFTQGLAYAMRLATGRPGFDRLLAQSPIKPGDALEDLTAWLAEVTFLGAESRLFLDEVQSAPTDLLEEALPYLLLNAPPNLRIILASRGRLDLPVADIAARGLYLAVGSDQMRLSLAETTTILRSRFGERISPDDCSRLHDKIAGWPLGLQLAVTSIEKSANLSSSIEALNALSGDFAQYFLGRLVAGLEPATIGFLEEISLLDALEPRLCRAVADRADAVELLAGLRETLPIFTEGVGTEWLRLHPLARDYLRSRLGQRDPAAIRVLHERAAAWLAANGLLEEAAWHEQAAGNTARAAALVSDCIHDMMIHGHQHRVLDWLERMPAGAARPPSFLIGAAWALAESARHAEVAALVNELDANPAATDSDRFEGSLIRAGAAFFADHIDTTEQILRPWEAWAATESRHRGGIHANCRATMLLYDGKTEQARQLMATIYRGWPREVDAVRGWGEWVVGFSYLWEGQVDLAVEVLQASLRKNEDALGRRAGQTSMYAATLSEALWNNGRPDEAAAILADRLDVIERLTSPEAITMGYRTAARMAEANGQARRAFDLLDYLHALGESRQVPRYCVNSLAEQVRIHALAGHAETCRTLLARLETLAESFGPPMEGKVRPLLYLRLGTGRAYAALAAHDWRRLQAALGEPRAIVDRLRRGRERIELMLLAALAEHHLGDDAQGLAAEAVSLADTFGLKTHLVNTNPRLFDWLRRDRSTPASLPPVVTAPLTKPVPASQPQKTTGLLTLKEVEILGFLERNLSNKTIATTLGISDQTVKWHIKNLFSKLNAGSRKHVVDRARMLGILRDAG